MVELDDCNEPPASSESEKMCGRGRLGRATHSVLSGSKLCPTDDYLKDKESRRLTGTGLEL